MGKVFAALWRAFQWLLVILGGISALGLFIFVAAVWRVQHEMDGRPPTLPVDCAIVFGAAVYSNRLPGPAIVRRIATAAELYREKKVKRLILSGGRGEGNAVSEAVAMEREAARAGVKKADMILEQNSHSTWDNLLYSKNLTSGCSSVVGISDGYHLARIQLLAKRLGWGELPTIPSEMRPPEESEKKSMFREAFALIFYGYYLDLWIPATSIEQFKDVPEKAFLPVIHPQIALVPIKWLT